MFIVSKTLKQQEYLYSNNHSILCKNEYQAHKLADFLNNHNNTNVGDFILKDNEIYRAYEIDRYDTPPMYILKQTKPNIVVEYNDLFDELEYMRTT